MRWPRTTMLEYSSEREMYHVGGWYLEQGARCEVMLAGRWLPGTVRQSRPAVWTVEVPVDHLSASFCASVLLTSGLRVRPARERAAEAARER